MPKINLQNSSIKPSHQLNFWATDLGHYLVTLIFGLLSFAAGYGYLTWLDIPNQLNKAVADTAIWLISLSMLLSSLCYFFKFFDKLIVYRKHLGLIGFGFAILHLWLSWSALIKLTDLSFWSDPDAAPVIAGLVATLIFTMMAAISNQLAATTLGSWWRQLLRLGYLGMILVFAHVWWLKSSRWEQWWENDMATPPSLSLIMTTIVLLTLIIRLIHQWAMTFRKINKVTKQLNN